MRCAAYGVNVRTAVRELTRPEFDPYPSWQLLPLPLLALAPPSPTKLSTRQTQKLRQYRPCSACLALDFKSSRVHISVYLPISCSIFLRCKHHKAGIVQNIVFIL